MEVTKGEDGNVLILDDDFVCTDVLTYPDIIDIIVPLYDIILESKDRNLPCTVFKISSPIHVHHYNKTYLYDHLWVSPHIQLHHASCATTLEGLEKVFKKYSESVSRYRYNHHSLSELIVYNHTLYSFMVIDGKLIVIIYPICDYSPKIDSIMPCDTIEVFDHTRIDWLDVSIDIEKKASPFVEDKWWYHLPKDGTIAGAITLTMNDHDKCTVDLIVAGENVWTSELSKHRTETIPISINMIRIGDHSLYVQTDSPNVKVKARYRLLRGIDTRKDMWTSCENSLKWFEVHTPSEWVSGEPKVRFSQYVNSLDE